MTILSVLFSALYIGIAFLNFIGTVHGPNLLGRFAIGTLALSLVYIWCLTVYFNKKPKSARLYAGFVCIGLLPIGLGLSLWPLTSKLERWATEHRDRKVSVTDFEDASYRSKKGNLLGLRIRFTLRVPKDDYYHFSPSLELPAEVYSNAWQHAREPFGTPGPFTLRVVKVTSEPALPLDVPTPYGLLKKKTDYRFTLIAVPQYLIMRKNPEQPCILSWPENNRRSFEWIANLAEPTPYHFVLLHSGTAIDTVTKTHVSQNNLYQGIKAEDYPTCGTGMTLYSSDVSQHDL